MGDVAPPRPNIVIDEDDVTRPLLERQTSQNSGDASSGEEAPRQFRAARREAAQDAVLHRDTWASAGSRFVLCLGGVALLSVPIFIIYVEVRSWYILMAFGNAGCDQHLALWLLVRNVLTWTVPRTPDPNSDLNPEELASLRVKARTGALFSMVWLALGCVWTFKATACPHTNPELFMWVRFLTFFGVGVLVMTTTFPFIVLLIVVTYHGMVNRGWIKSPNAASDHAIDRLETVTFSADLFQDSSARSPGADSRGMPRPSKDCCCCMEEFCAEKIIVLTPCGHFYHRDCLQEWLRLARTCPLCRCNIDDDALYEGSA